MRGDPVETPLYHILKEELVLALGQEAYDQLCTVAASGQSVPS